MKQIFTSILFVTLSLTLPKAQAERITQTKYGPQVEIGKGGIGYAWARVARGKLQSLGVNISASALNELPQHGEMIEFVLYPPKGIQTTPIHHIGLDWNPEGHDPSNIYDLPHFDAHFYLMTLEARNRITCAGADEKRCTKMPRAAQIPEGYVPTPGGEPRMGSHWIDPTSDEFQGGRFTKTFIYGFYDGRMVFLEPMVTSEYLMTKPDFVQPIAQPQSYSPQGYYPTHYRVNYDSVRDEYSLSLEGMVWRL